MKPQIIYQINDLNSWITISENTYSYYKTSKAPVELRALTSTEWLDQEANIIHAIIHNNELAMGDRLQRIASLIKMNWPVVIVQPEVEIVEQDFDFKRDSKD